MRFDNGFVFAHARAARNGIPGRLLGAQRLGSCCGGDKIKEEKVVAKPAVANEFDVAADLLNGVLVIPGEVSGNANHTKCPDR